MKKLLKNFISLLRLTLFITLISQLNVAKIHAQENNWLYLPQFVKQIPVPTPIPEEPKPADPVLPEDSGSWTRFKYQKIIADTALKYELDPQLIYATIMTESEGDEFAYRYEPHLDEPSLCMGQILISTARNLGFTGDPLNIYEPEICIDLIGKYYRTFIDQYGNLSAQQLARAYNTGSPWKRPVWGHLTRFNKWYNES